MIYHIPDHIRYKVASGAAEEPLTVAEAQTHLRIDGDATYLAMLIAAARTQCEAFTCRTMVATTYEQYFDDFGPEEFLLYWGPVSSVSSIQYYDEDDVLQTFGSGGYHVDNVMDRCRIYLDDDYSWPDVEDKPNAVKITYTAGYANAAAVPAQLKYAMLLMIGEMYERRENHVKNLPTAVEHLMMPYRLWQS